MAAEAAAAAATAAAAAAAAGTTGLTGWALLSTAAAPTLIVCLLGAVGAAMAHRVRRRQRWNAFAQSALAFRPPTASACRSQRARPLPYSLAHV